MASTGFRICRSITFSGRLILPDRHTSPQPQNLCLRFLDISDLVEGVLTNFEYCHQLFLYWRRVDFAGINTNLSSSSEFLFQRYLLSLSLTSLVLKQAPSHEWCARCLLLVESNLKPRSGWRQPELTQGLEVGGWTVGGIDRRWGACALPR